MKKNIIFLRHHGFTLIELLVVVSIIVIIAALALPSITASINKSQAVKGVNNVRSLYLATESASIDGVRMGLTNIGFPGDVGGQPQWQAGLINGGYLSGPQFTNLFYFPNPVYNGAVALNNVSSSSQPNDIFMTSWYVMGYIYNYGNTYTNASTWNYILTQGGSVVLFQGTNVNLPAYNAYWLGSSGYGVGTN